MKKAFSFLVVLLLAGGLGPLAARQAAGLVVNVAGKVNFIKLGQSIKAKAKDLVETGDVLETEGGSRLTIQFTNGVIAQAGPRTRVEIQKLIKLMHGKAVGVGLKKGTIAVSASGKDFAELQIKTPTAIASVRGTEFIVEADDKESQVLVNEGSVAVSNAEGNEETNVEGGSKASCSGSEVKTSILKRYEKQKFAIIERFKKYRVAQLERVIEERQKLKAKIEEQKERDRERMERLKKERLED